jgi:26S proteasome regulatory subunit N1
MICLAIVGKYHYLLYFLALAIQPRMLVTFDESLRPLPVPVRVGQVSFSLGENYRKMKSYFSDLGS